MSAPSTSGAQAAKVITLDLSPGVLRGTSGSAFQLTLPEWYATHDYFSGVGRTYPWLFALFVEMMPAYTDVKLAAEKWGASTLPGIVELARRTDQYGANVMPGWLRDMQQCLGELDGPNGGDAQATFDGLMAQLLAETQQNEVLAAAVARDLAAIDTAFQLLPVQEQAYIAKHGSRPGGDRIPSDQVDSIYKMSQVANQIDLLMHPPVLNIERIRGGWGALTDELRQFEATLGEARAEGEPFMVELDLDAALLEWNNLAEEARTFVNAASNF